VREQQRFDPVARREIDQLGPVQVAGQQLGQTFPRGRVEVAAACAQQD